MRDPLYGWRLLLWAAVGYVVGLFILRSTGVLALL